MGSLQIHPQSSSYKTVFHIESKTTFYTVEFLPSFWICGVHDAGT